MYSKGGDTADGDVPGINDLMGYAEEDTSDVGLEHHAASVSGVTAAVLCCADSKRN